MVHYLIPRFPLYIKENDITDQADTHFLLETNCPHYTRGGEREIPIANLRYTVMIQPDKFAVFNFHITIHVLVSLCSGVTRTQRFNLIIFGKVVE